MRPKVALDYRPALLSPAGIGRATRELARALAARGDVELHLFGHSLAHAAVACAPPPGARLHRWPIPGRSLPLLRRLGIGADHLAGGASVFHWTDYVQPPVARARTVLTIHDLAFLRDASWHGNGTDVLRVRTQRAAAAAACVVAPSRATADDVRAHLPEVARTVVIPFGADHVPGAVAARPDVAGDYVLCLGTIEPRKNHGNLLLALRQLPPPRPHLVVVGQRGWECDAAVQALQQAVAEGAATWLQRASDKTTWALLQHARLLVYPSLWEGFGFPPLEAMALGTPVVAHACAPLEELTDGNALLADARAPAALAAAIARGLGDRELRERLAAGGRARAASFRWSACAAAHADLYREVSGMSQHMSEVGE